MTNEGNPGHLGPDRIRCCRPTATERARGEGQFRVLRELNFGVAVARTAQAGALRLSRMQRIIAVFGSGVPFDDLVAASFGLLYGVAHAAGQRSRTRVADLMIAATAHHLGAALVTRNPADFDAISADVEILAR